MAVLTFLFFLFASPADNVIGTILDPTGASVAGARVEISAAALSQSATTDRAGTFSIEGVPSGTYSLRVTASGFSAYVTSVEIPSDGLKVVLSVAPRSVPLIKRLVRNISAAVAEQAAQGAMAAGTAVEAKAALRAKLASVAAATALFDDGFPG